MRAGGLSADAVPALKLKLLDEYPSKDPRMNRELARLVAFYDQPQTPEMFLEQLPRHARSGRETAHRTACTLFDALEFGAKT